MSDSGRIQRTWRTLNPMKPHANADIGIFTKPSSFGLSARIAPNNALKGIMQNNQYLLFIQVIRGLSSCSSHARVGRSCDQICFGAGPFAHNIITQKSACQLVSFFFLIFASAFSMIRLCNRSTEARVSDMEPSLSITRCACFRFISSDI